MKKFKKIVAVLTALAIGLVCASCSNNSDSDDGNNGNSNKVLTPPLLYQGDWYGGNNDGAPYSFYIHENGTWKVTKNNGSSIISGTWDQSHTISVGDKLTFTITYMNNASCNTSMGISFYNENYLSFHGGSYKKVN